TTDTATIEDNESGVINFQADQSYVAGVDPTVKSTLLITSIGSGTPGLDTPLTITASNTGTGTATAADLTTAFGTPLLTFAAGDRSEERRVGEARGAQDDQHPEEEETTNLHIGRL